MRFVDSRLRVFQRYDRWRTESRYRHYHIGRLSLQMLAMPAVPLEHHQKQHKMLVEGVYLFPPVRPQHRPWIIDNDYCVVTSEVFQHRVLYRGNPIALWVGGKWWLGRLIVRWGCIWTRWCQWIRSRERRITPSRRWRFGRVRHVVGCLEQIGEYTRAMVGNVLEKFPVLYSTKHRATFLSGFSFRKVG